MGGHIGAASVVKRLIIQPSWTGKGDVQTALSPSLEGGLHRIVYNSHKNTGQS